MTAATLLSDHGRPAIRIERHLPDPPDNVWRALTERDQVQSWFPSDVIVSGGEWKVGASVEFPFRPEVLDMTLTGEFVEVDEPSTLVFTWGEDTLRFELSSGGGGKHLILIDELPPGTASRNTAGWDECLDRLAGLEPQSDGWERRFRAYSVAFEPALGPQEGPPTG